MLQRLYVHNFKCLENFELSLKDLPSALLIGKNGTGKSTIASVLEILQSIGRGTNRMSDLDRLQLLRPKDFAQGRSDVPIRFELEVILEGQLYKYALALDLPHHFRELRVLEEQLLIAGEAVYSRKEAQVTLHYRNAEFLVDWHLVALPIIQEQAENNPIHRFKTWLAQMVILAPIPSLMTGESNGETLEPKRDGSNFGDWASGLLSRYPAAYRQTDEYLRTVMPDIQDFVNEPVGRNAKNMVVRFEGGDTTLSVDFEDLSDGEKCFFLCALVLAANKYYNSLFCFWDEPDNYISIPEVGHFIIALRRSFNRSGQILVTSHNDEAIRRFSDENTFVLDRKSHVEPTLIRLLEDIPIQNELIDALILDDVKL